MLISSILLNIRMSPMFTKIFYKKKVDKDEVI